MHNSNTTRADRAQVRLNRLPRFGQELIANRASARQFLTLAPDDALDVRRRYLADAGYGPRGVRRHHRDYQGRPRHHASF